MPQKRKPPQFILKILDMLQKFPDYFIRNVHATPSSVHCQQKNQLQNGCSCVFHCQLILCKISYIQENILGKYFRHDKLSSFVRQLNMYGFWKIQKNYEGDYVRFGHHTFWQGNEQAYSMIKRKSKDKSMKNKCKFQQVAHLQNQSNIKNFSQQQSQIAINPNKNPCNANRNNSTATKTKENRKNQLIEPNLNGCKQSSLSQNAKKQIQTIFNLNSQYAKISEQLCQDLCKILQCIQKNEQEYQYEQNKQKETKSIKNRNKNRKQVEMQLKPICNQNQTNIVKQFQKQIEQLHSMYNALKSVSLQRRQFNLSYGKCLQMYKEQLDCKGNQKMVDWEQLQQQQGNFYEKIRQNQEKVSILQDSSQNHNFNHGFSSNKSQQQEEQYYLCEQYEYPACRQQQQQQYQYQKQKQQEQQIGIDQLCSSSNSASIMLQHNYRNIDKCDEYQQFDNTNPCIFNDEQYQHNLQKNPLHKGIKSAQLPIAVHRSHSQNAFRY